MRAGIPSTANKQSAPRGPRLSEHSGDAKQSSLLPYLPVGFTILFLGLALLPRVREQPTLVATFVGVAAFLFAWEALTFLVARRTGRRLLVELVPPVKSHYIQASVQLSIYAYWGWYWREIYSEAPLIFSQIVFLYVFDALLSWARGRSWRLGFGPLPIVLSINVFIWFRDDWFAFQYLLVAACALGKEFLRWRREGRSTHIFNPSAFGLTVVSLVLIVTETTKEYTWARELASTIDKAPHIYLVIFLLGLVVQYNFSVTLMTLSATAALCVLNLTYTQVTGVYQFVNTNLSAAVFLGIHLLVTDPSTSPRTNAGRVVFGALYGVGNWVLFDVLRYFGAPELYTKLLVVPALNLAVPMIDRMSRSGWLGTVESRWSAQAPPRRLNLIHIGVWTALFAVMWGTGFVEGPHPGNSIPFWKRAHAEGKPDAGKNLILVALAQAGDGSGAANAELGVICIRGELTKKEPGVAARYFSRACALNDASGCANVAIQYHFFREWRSEEDVTRALGLLENDCSMGRYGGSCFLIGYAYEIGRGRPVDRERARQLYEKAGPADLFAIKGLARLALSGTSPPGALAGVAAALKEACEAGDAESCWYLAYLHLAGLGVPRDAGMARSLLERACKLGSADACRIYRMPKLPPYSEPILEVPAWSTAFPL